MHHMTEVGERFAEERRRLGYGRPEQLAQTGAITTREIKIVEQLGGPLKDGPTMRRLIGLGMDLRYVLWGDRELAADEQTMLLVWRGLGAGDRAKVMRFAAELAIPTADNDA